MKNNLDSAIVLSLFCGFTLKAGILGSSISDAIIILGLASAHFLHQLHLKNKNDESLQTQINELKSTLVDQGAIISDLRTSVTGVKLGQSFMKAK